MDVSALVARYLLCGTKHIYQYTIQPAGFSGPQVEQKVHPIWTLRAMRFVSRWTTLSPPTTIIQAMDSRLLKI
jgi:hypothetical protein